MNPAPFTVADAIRNPHRLTVRRKAATSTQRRPAALAGANMPLVGTRHGGLARLFDLLAGTSHVVVDASRGGRNHAASVQSSETVPLVAHADVASLWSANRIQQYLGETEDERVRLVPNRFRKIAGFSEADAEAAAEPAAVEDSQSIFAVSAIDRGVPRSCNSLSDGPVFAGLAAA
jgi:Flp pilus assembly CpaE family ATPase